MQIDGRSALITGGSRGLGAALGRGLAGAGARVVLVARGAEELDRVVQAIRSEGGDAHGFAADIGAKEDIHRIAGAAAALAGPLDILVHNASTLGPTPLRLLLDTECEDLGRVLDVNLLGPFRLTRAVVGGMVLRGRGLVLQITSDASVNAYPTWGAYGISKAALDHLGRTWAAELSGTGVRVLTVDPGEMRTAMHADAMPDADPSTLADPDAVAERLVEIIRDEGNAASGARVEASGWVPSLVRA
ncbi:MAG TPA: SDR family oxidoreductase [Vicinamibacteria bacterium]|nr:SDR family oxidoreductase [Vicinamibacteria bacterium]